MLFIVIDIAVICLDMIIEKIKPQTEKACMDPRDAIICFASVSCFDIRVYMISFYLLVIGCR